MASQPPDKDAIKPASGTPVFRKLERGDVDALLARNHVGRVAYSLHDRVDIEPISYAYSEGWIYGRTSHGTKLAVISHHRWVAFEVDEVQGPFDWQSVVVKGAFYLISADTPETHDPAFTRGVELLRAVVPETLTANDPTPFRHSIFRIHLDEVSGRSASTKG